MKNYFKDLTKDKMNLLLSKKYLKEKVLEVEEIDNGYILPAKKSRVNEWYNGGVLNENKEYIKLSSQLGYGMTNRVDKGYEINENEIEYIDETVIYMNNYIKHWGHYLIDVIGRMWYPIENTNLRIAYTPNYLDGSELSGNFLETIELMGIPRERLLCVKKVTKFRKIVLPESSIYPGLYYTKEYKYIFDEIVKNALKGFDLKDQNKKIYCSRMKFFDAKGKETGESQIENLFNINGFESVSMETLTVREQIILLNSAKEVVCFNGTLPHNAMFIRNKECKFTILNKTYRVLIHLGITNQVSSASIRYIDIYMSPLPVIYGKGPFIVTITRELLEYVKDNNMIAIDKINKVKEKEKIQYYFEWLKKYWRKLYKNHSIGGKEPDEYRIDYKDIRKQYRKDRNSD